MKNITAKKSFLGIAVLVIVYIVGLVGFLLPETRSLFQQLTAINLLFASTVVFLIHRKWTTPFVLAMLMVGLAGWLVELAGVHTGVIFGDYTYGQALGWGLWGIPFMIGLNWMILIYCTGTMANNIQQPVAVQASIGAALMVLLDIFIEPFAIQFDLWQWQGDAIPIQNYVAWYIIAWIMLFGVLKLQVLGKNKVAVALYLCQLVFFVVLTFTVQ